MMNGWFFRRAYVTRLHALAGEQSCALMERSAIPTPYRLAAKADQIHHDEHVLKAAVRFAHDVAVAPPASPDCMTAVGNA